MDRECVHATREFSRKRLINHSVTFEPGLSFECLRHDIHTVVGFPARPVPGVALMLMRFVQDFEALRRESLGQLFCDEVGSPHAARLGEGSPSVNGAEI